ncbi:Aste57867_7399 [Aphanomyces stellatus]|nr:hypothetical protein As57867_007373 [Aphanomyces stellatus]VFT84314.1 Aste57867_7399 [Aphanomyces stellatus]
MCHESTSGAVRSPLELIAPCSCLTYVHRQCLDHWRATSDTYHAMTECPTCHDEYRIQRFEVPNADALDDAIKTAKRWRWVLVLSVLLVGSLVTWLVDRGTPAYFHIHWNGLDGQLTNWMGLTHVPRFLDYFGASVVVATCFTSVLAIRSWCGRSHTASVSHTLDDVESGGQTDRVDCRTVCAALICGILVVSIVFVALVMMLPAMVGALGSTIDRRCEKHIRSFQVQRERIFNLRPLTDDARHKQGASVPVVESPSSSLMHVHVTPSGYEYRCACDAPTGVALGHVIVDDLDTIS